MKKIISLLLIFVMVISLSTVAFAAKPYDRHFNDIYQSENQEAIEFLYEMGILQGYGNGYYGPARTLTRAEACTIIVRMMVENYGIRKSHTSFVDVADNAWYREYVDTAHREGYMNGYGNNTFGPEDEVTYAQFATIILNMLGYDCVNLDGTWPANVEEIAEVLGLYRRIGGFVSNDAICREDVAQMLYNALRCKMVRIHNGKFISTGKTLGEFINKTSDNNEFNTVIGTVESINYNRYYNNGYFIVTFEEYDEDFYVSTEKYNARNFREGQSMTFTYYFNRAIDEYFITEITIRNANTRFYRDMEVARILPGGGNLCRVTFTDGSMFNIEGSRDNLGFSVLDTISFHAEKNMYDEIGLITSVVKVAPYVESEVNETPEINIEMENCLKRARDYLNLMSFSRQGLIDQLLYEGYSMSAIEYALDVIGYDVFDSESETNTNTELDPGFGVEPEVFYTAEGWTRFHTADCHYVTEAEDGVVITFDPAVHTEQTACKICLADLYE